MKLLQHLNRLWQLWRAFRRKHLLLTGLLGWALIIGTWLTWQYNRLPGAALDSYNHTQRPIFSFWVNDNWGGNAAANGGGGLTCCWRIEGKTLRVQWIKSITRTQYALGLREQTLSLEIPNPPRQRTDDTLHVHFLPSDQVRVAWSRGHISPLKDELREFFIKDQENRTREHP